MLLQPINTLVKTFWEKIEGYYRTIIDALEKFALKIIVVAGVLLSLIVGLPLMALIRAITPRRKAA